MEEKFEFETVVNTIEDLITHGEFPFKWCDKCKRVVVNVSFGNDGNKMLFYDCTGETGNCTDHIEWDLMLSRHTKFTVTMLKKDPRPDQNYMYSYYVRGSLFLLDRKN